jgi:signal transduction histidine kinase
VSINPSVRRGRRVWRLQGLLLLTVVTLVLLLVVTATATAVARRTVAIAEGNLRDRLDPAQVAAEDLTTAYADQETGQRGFLLTGGPDFLQPYVAGQQEAQKARLDLGRRLASDPLATRLLADVDAAASTWQAQAEAQIAQRQRGPLSSRQLASTAASGKTQFDTLRSRLGAVGRRAEVLADAQAARLAAAQSWADLVGAAAVVLALLVSALTVPLLRRYLSTPLELLVRQVRTVAGGKYDQPIDALGPEELQIIADAVEQMRKNMLSNSERLMKAQHRITLMNEHDRIAGDLHDLTIQRVFALGLMLQSAVGREPSLAPYLDPLIDETDRIIRELRRVIFGITPDREVSDLRSQVTDLVQESARSLTFRPELEFEGPVDHVAWEEMSADLLATLREALSNVARHARASSATIRLAAVDDDLRLTVTDDGVGFPPGGRAGHGLKNFRYRAERWGGSASVTSTPGAGTTLRWQVPLAS